MTVDPSRWDRDFATRMDLGRALLLSLLLHTFLFLLAETGRQLGWWRENPLAWFNNRRITQSALMNPVTPPVPQEVPLLFVEVDPQHAETEPPPNAIFYSSLSSRAANPDTRKDLNTPKIEGQQENIVKTFDTLRPQPIQAPAPPQVTPATPAPTPPLAVQEVKPRGGQEAGDLVLAKPLPKASVETGNEESDRQKAAPQPQPQAQPQPQQRPRTLAAARMAKGMIVGEKMKQDGGVSRYRVDSSLDVKATKFGAYDAQVVAAIQQRWYDLLDQRGYVPRTGKVVLEFKLHHNGRITDMKTLETSVGDFLTLLCQKAVEDPAPYPNWPADMRREMPRDYREVRFTFYYN